MLKITQHYNVPTGNIICCKGEKGQLEFVSVGDYGKETNIKADFLNLNRTPKPFTHTKMLPLTKKWVITISTQYGCSMNCLFCDVPSVGSGVNATYDDMIGQIELGLSLHPHITHTERLNIHFARMGEPTFNFDVIKCAEYLKTFKLNFCVHPVVSTIMPKKNSLLPLFIQEWMRIKNIIYGGNAGLQISLNSTDETERQKMFSGNALDIKSISAIMSNVKPIGRKITLNFAVANYTIDPNVLQRLFPPKYFLIKLTPMHKTNTAETNNIRTNTTDYTAYHPYEQYEKELTSVGYDVIVFLASEAEDMGRITCGNAILSGSTPYVDDGYTFI